MTSPMILNRHKNDHYVIFASLEALPGVLWEQGKRAFISGEQGNKGQILRGTGEQRPNFEGNRD